jgi:hypothetical protein
MTDQERAASATLVVRRLRVILVGHNAGRDPVPVQHFLQARGLLGQRLNLAPVHHPPSLCPVAPPHEALVFLNNHRNQVQLGLEQRQR